MEQFHQTFHNLLTCLSCHPLPRCFSSQKKLCAALAHRTMHSLPIIFSFSRLGRHVLHIENLCTSLARTNGSSAYARLLRSTVVIPYCGSSVTPPRVILTHLHRNKGTFKPRR